MSEARRTLLLVVDGLGIGAMPDADTVDRRASTLRHVVPVECESQFPAFQKAGLFTLLDQPIAARGVRAGLGYPGADSYQGQNEVLGGVAPAICPDTISDRRTLVAQALSESGRHVEMLMGGRALWVDKSVLVYDNLEAKPGMAINVAGSLQTMDFGHIERIGHTVRNHVRNPRVIVFASPLVSPEMILQGIHIDPTGRVGISAPDVGFYQDGYEVRHFGAGYDPALELPDRLAMRDIPVVLVGKMADVAESSASVLRFPLVDTKEALRMATYQFDQMKTSGGFVAVTVQETDLAGHDQDVSRFRSHLTNVDRWLTRFIPCLKASDMVILTADHGNDPTIGSHHSREFVPVLVFGPKVLPPDSPLPNLRGVADKIFRFMVEGGSNNA